MSKLAAIWLLFSIAFSAHAQNRQVTVNPFDLKVEQNYTGAWHGTVREVLYNGTNIYSLDLADEKPILSEVVVRAQAAKNMVIIDFAVIEAIANESSLGTVTDHLANVSKILTATSIPIPADDEREKIRELEDKLKAAEERAK